MQSRSNSVLLHQEHFAAMQSEPTGEGIVLHDVIALARAEVDGPLRLRLAEAETAARVDVADVRELVHLEGFRAALNVFHAHASSAQLVERVPVLRLPREVFVDRE